MNMISKTPSDHKKANVFSPTTNLRNATSSTYVQKGIEGTGAKPSIWNAVTQWVSDATIGVTSLFSHSVFQAPAKNAKPQEVLEYIKQIKEAALTDRDRAMYLTQASSHAAANEVIKTAYIQAIEQIRDPILKDLAAQSLANKKRLLEQKEALKMEFNLKALSRINAPKDSPNAFHDAFFNISKIENPTQRRRAFADLALQLVGTNPDLEKLKLEYLNYTKQLTTDEQKREALSPFDRINLDAQQFDACIDVIKTIGNNKTKAICLEKIAKYCPDDSKLQEIVQLIRALRGTHSKI